MLNFSPHIERIEIYHRAAGFEDRVITNYKVGRIGEAQPNSGAFLHADLLKALSGAIYQIADFGIAV